MVGAEFPALTTSMVKENIYFTLVHPKEPGNVGAAARALKNMGFRRLCIVNPCDYLSAEANALAHGAADVLENATVYSSLSEAISDKTIVVGTTRHMGKTRGVIYPIKEAVDRIVNTAANNKVAILFGREDNGLYSSEINTCGYLMTIATSSAQPSLNLAQAVLIVAYELSLRLPDNTIAAHTTPEQLMPQADLHNLYNRITEALHYLGFSMRGSENLESDIERNVKHLVGRYGLTRWELDMLHGLCSAIISKSRNQDKK
ncbi:MAG: RNA methyltransferase [Nitrospirae bacterium]|nr:RNA methyltransferase [Nitrospirota bacterium]